MTLRWFGYMNRSRFPPLYHGRSHRCRKRDPVAFHPMAAPSLGSDAVAALTPSLPSLSPPPPPPPFPNAS